MTLNLEAELPLLKNSDEKLILIPSSTLHVTKQKVSQNYDEKQQFNPISPKSKSPSSASLSSTSSRSSRKSKKNSDVAVCRSVGSAQRVFEVQAQLLTPKSASKIYGTNKKSSSLDFSHFSKNEPSKVQPLKNIADISNNTSHHLPTFSVSSADSTLTDSILDDITTIDSSSLFSETTSICTEDGVDRTLSFSLPEESELNDANRSHNYISSVFPQNLNHDTKYSICYEDAVQSTNNFNASADYNSKTHNKNIEISPLITLPITTIQSTQQNKSVVKNTDPISSNIQHLPNNDSFSDDTSFLSEDDKLTELPSFRSCSSLSLDQDGLLLNGYPTINGNDCHDNVSESELARELVELKQSLKLAEADTAILVSSKQQLQLQVHDLNDKKKKLETKLQKTQNSLNQSETNSLVAQRNLEKIKEKYENEQNLQNKENLSLKKSLQDITNDLSSIKLERDQLKSNNTDFKQQLDVELLNKANLQKELNEITVKSSKLESLLQESSNDNVDNKDYINIIRTERDDYAKKIYEKDQEILNQNLKLMQIQDMFTALEKSNLKLTRSNAELSDSLRKTENQVKSLQSQVSIQTKEKLELDGAVTRLHGDLYRVEAGFTKIKEEIKQKSEIADRGLTLQSNLELKISELEKELDLSKKNSTIQKQRINDKNNQIAQILAQLKLSTESNKNSDYKNNQLETVNENYEKLKTEFNRIEAELKRKLDEKSTELVQSEIKTKDLNKKLEYEKNEKTLIQSKFEGLISDADLKQKLIQELELNMNILNEKLKLSEIDKEEQNIMIEKLKNEAENAKVIETNLKEKIENLQKKIVENQNISSEEDESKALQHLNILSELQSSRRELISELDELKTKNQISSEEIKSLQENIEKLKNENTKILELNKNQEINKKDYNYEILELQTKFKESEKLVSLLKENSAILSKTISTMEQENEKYKQKIELKNTESEAYLKQNRILKEELTTAKQQLNLNSLKLMEEVQKHENQSSDWKKSLDFVLLERNKLKEAVDQQQRYIVSLQQHYQQWAVNASTLMQQQAQQQQNTQQDVVKNDTACDISSRDIGTQTLHDEIPIMTSQKPTKSIDSSDIGTQTDHNEELMTSSKYLKNIPGSNKDYNHVCTQTYRNMKTTEIGVQTSQDVSDSFSQTIIAEYFTTKEPKNSKILADAFSQTDLKVMIEFGTQTNFDQNSVLSQTCDDEKSISEAGTQTLKDNEIKNSNCSEKVFKNINTQTDVEYTSSQNFNKFSQTDSRNQLIDVGSQTEHNKIEISSERKDVELINSSTQTSHDEMPVNSSSNYSISKDKCVQIEKCEVFSAEIGIQTDCIDVPTDGNSVLYDHNSLQTSFETETKEIGVQTEHDSFTIMDLTNLIPENENLEKSFNDIGTQTLHDEIPIMTSQKPKENYNSSNIGTQTDHNELSVNSTYYKNEPTYFKNNSSQTEKSESKEIGNQTDFIEVSQLNLKNSFSQTDEFIYTDTGVQTNSEDFPVLCEICALRNRTLLSNTSTQTLNDLEKNFEDFKNCSPKMHQDSSSQTDNDPEQSFPPLPDPMDVAKIFNEEDSMKLKAYKKTVKLLKSKLKKAENEIIESKKLTTLLQKEIENLKESLRNELKCKNTENCEEVVKLDLEKDKENMILQNELVEVKKFHQQEVDQLRKRNGIHRIQAEKRIRDASERIRALVDANERLRKMVDKLQVKLTYSNKQQEIHRREKLRYQHRARKLQSDLRSLSWLSSSNNQLKNTQSRINSNTFDQSGCGVTEKDKSDINEKLNNKLPSAVGEIDDILKTLRSEISALEQQLTDHTSLVDQSNATWKQVGRLNEVNTNLTESGDGRYIV